jgi:hypothetical protein
VGVSQGVTLTIEPGTILNLNSNYIIVNGTLLAKGTNTDKIGINGFDSSPQVTPVQSAPANSARHAGFTFNDYTRIGPGSVIENALINSTSIALGKLDQINNCIIIGSIGTGPSAIISNSQVTGRIDTGGTAKVFNNEVKGEVHAKGGSPEIYNNSITGNDGITFELTDNIVISGNTVSYCNVGIQGSDFATITNNLIIDNNCGILVGYLGGDIKENTVARNRIGIRQFTTSIPSLAISNNNFENNGYNYYITGEGFNANAPQNWWGTTNTTSISQTIHENKNNFDFGTVAFTPFLTTPNSEAPAIPTPTLTPTPNASLLPSQNPTSTSNQSNSNNSAFFRLDWTQTAIVAGLGITAIVLIVVAIMFLNKMRK